MDHQDLFAGKNVLELGAGAGLSGVVAYQFAKNVVITDGNDIVYDLILKNVQMHQRDASLSGRLFLWGREEALKLMDALPFQIDIIIGADIIFWPQSIVGLAETIAEFTKRNPATQIYIAGAKRSQLSEDEIDANLLKHGNKKRVVTHTYNHYNMPVYLYMIK